MSMYMAMNIQHFGVSSWLKARYLYKVIGVLRGSPFWNDEGAGNHGLGFRVYQTNFQKTEISNRRFHRKQDLQRSTCRYETTLP